MAEIQVNNIVKTYNKGSLTAVNNVSFSVEKAELMGLIGPDGAGKTTIFRILTSLLLPDRGTASIRGHDIIKEYKTIRKELGYMPGKFSLYQDLTVEENLSFFAGLFNQNVAENYDLIKDIYVQLEPFKKRRAGKLSGGMKQKLALCCALIHNPKILFLDEPTTGVDAVSRKEFWQILKELKKREISILVSTPYMDEAKLCERIVLIQNGSIMSIDTPENTENKYGENLYALKTDNMNRLQIEVRTVENIKSCFAFGEQLHLTFYQDDLVKKKTLIKYLKEQNHTNIELKQIAPSIEDYFIKLTNK